MTTLLEILHRKAEPYRVTLTKGQRGTYGWEITVSAENFEVAHIALQCADADLQHKFGKVARSDDRI